METRYLNTLVASVEAGTFSKAAELLHFTIQSVLQCDRIAYVSRAQCGDAPAKERGYSFEGISREPVRGGFTFMATAAVGEVVCGYQFFYKYGYGLRERPFVRL
jgi:hypothetical protein